MRRWCSTGSRRGMPWFPRRPRPSHHGLLHDEVRRERLGLGEPDPKQLAEEMWFDADQVDAAENAGPGDHRWD